MNFMDHLEEICIIMKKFDFVGKALRRITRIVIAEINTNVGKLM